MPIVILDAIRSIWALRRDAGFVALGILLAFAVLGGGVVYWLVEDLTLFDAVYLSATTVTTVGYGDPSPETAAGKGFTVAFSVVGIGILLAFVAILGEHMRRHSVLRGPLGRLTARRDAALPAPTTAAPAGYDLLVVGTDEASRRAAVEAAAAGLRVVLVDPEHLPAVLDEAA
jgi:Ion channel